MADEEYIHMLATLALAGEEYRVKARQHLNALSDVQFAKLSSVAAQHHVVIRAFAAGSLTEGLDRFATLVNSERTRVQTAVNRLREVCQALEENECPVVVIKSLDHLPDFGSDLDLLTCSSEKRVVRSMRDRFGITIETPSWADRVARKVNFRLPGLPELVEIHFGRLGQAGEIEKLAIRIMQRRVRQQDEGFWVPPPEERIILIALQRLYRHFYLRICDIMTVANILDARLVDFDELRRASKKAAVWPGVATLLRLASDYIKHYRGEALTLPRRVQVASRFGIEKVFPAAGFLRLPLFPQGAELYARQLVKMLRRRDTAGTARLGLVPPLALAANVRYKLTGDQHGIW
jgi:hypothetical protein